MSIQFGDTRIGEMRYNGANIVEAMYDGQIVWQAGGLTPYELGAIHWLPFNDDPLEDIGTAPATWQEFQTPTVSGGALVSGRVRYPANSTYDPANGSTVTGWVRNTSTSITYGNAPLSATASYSKIEFRANSAGSARWAFRRGAATAQIIIAGTVPEGWAFIAACMEPVSGTTWRYRAYINGDEVVNDTYDAGTQHAVTFNSALFDARYADISDAAIYNHALTPQDIADLHDAGRTT